MIVKSRSGRSNRLRIMVRGLLLWLLGLMLGAYLGVVGAWYAVLEQRPVNYVTFVDCLLAPVRWDDIKRKRGEAFVDEGLAAMQERKWTEAALKIKAGLDRAPHYWKGRRSLGIFYVLAGQREQGIRTLIDGFETIYPGRDAVELVLRLALAGENYPAAIAVVDQALGLPGAAVERDREFLVDQKSRVLTMAGRYEENLAWLAQLSRLTDVRHESKVVALIELGRYDEAREALAAWQEGSGVWGGVRRMTVRLEREAGDLDAMRAALAEMKSRSPQNSQPWIYAAVQEYLAGESRAGAEALDAFLLRFGSKKQDILKAATPFKEIKAWEPFDVLMLHAEEMNMADASLLKLRVESALQRGRLEQAKTEMIRYQSTQRATPTSQELSWYQIMTGWIETLENDEVAMVDSLVSELIRPHVSLASGRQIALRLEEQDRAESARRIWQGLSRAYPNSLDVNRSLARIDAQLGKEAAREIVVPVIPDGAALDIDEILEARSGDVPDHVVVAMRSSRRFLTIAWDYIETENWAELDQLLRELRRSRPEWVRDHEPEIREIEIELNIGDENWPALVTNVRLQVDGSIDRALDLLKLARRLDGMGERVTAERILTEIERRNQNFPPAQRLREDWETADGSATAEAADAAEEDESADLLPVAE
mgnify:CR=1 FL=1